jgi:hypothetical protein
VSMRRARAGHPWSMLKRHWWQRLRLALGHAVSAA